MWLLKLVLSGTLNQSPDVKPFSVQWSGKVDPKSLEYFDTYEWMEQKLCYKNVIKKK